MRFTVKENDFYVITLNWSDKVLVKSLSKEVVGDAEILNIKLLGSDEAIDWKLTEEAWRFASRQKNHVNSRTRLRFHSIKK